jgi:hypothetical protein
MSHEAWLSTIAYLLLLLENFLQETFQLLRLSFSKLNPLQEINA